MSENKEISKVLDILSENNPHACFLNESTLSTVDKWYDTGSYVLNAIISGKIKDGGIPNGRLTMLYSESMCGKSLFVQKILANAQKQGVTPVIFDTENAIDPDGAARLGLDISKVKYVPVFSVEQCRNDLFKFLTAVNEKQLYGKFIVAIDSLGNLQSQMEMSRLEKDSHSMDMGTRARAIRTLLLNAVQLGALTKTAIIATNHLYDNPGELHPTLIKNMPGGKSCVYLPSVGIQLSRKPVKDDALKGETGKLAALQRNYVGLILRALTAKNRFIKQYLEGEVYVSFDTGVNKYYGLLDLAVGLGIIQVNGPTYTMGDVKLGYAKSFIKDYAFWEDKVIPLIQAKIDVEWKMGNKEDDYPIEELASE